MRSNAASFSPYSVPPGLLGELAQFIYAAAPRPVPEIALAGAIGLMAGICGRAYNVSNPPTGLNLYTLLLAPTGTGKEAIANGITALMKSIRQTVPSSVEFIGPASIASPQALAKYLANTSPSFVSILGEFGLTMQQMANPKAPLHLVGLRQIMLDLYNKSGVNSELRPSIYSEREKNTSVVASPAFSIIGESTPESFYEGLSERSVSDGLLPRFTIVEYRGDRPSRNEDAHAMPSPELAAKLAELCSYALSRNHPGQTPITVQLTIEAQSMFDDFDLYADEQIRGSTEVTRQLWNRAHIKALKLGALVAIGRTLYAPMITPDIALWAIQIEKTNVHNLQSRFETGEVGEQIFSEMSQQSRLRSVIKDWFLKPWPELQRYKIGTESMRTGGIVPYSYLSKRLTNDAAFKNFKTGATATLKRTIDELCKCGEINRVSPGQLKARYGITMESYAITDVEQFLAGLKHEVKSFF
ncbi:DUF3987 domain-containing protein [Stenotrophobium rhamnosiphilum]|uniref:DUF3987 domain-containing protein n=1 Tax=Stenotrophobium rhamnosiphilum TaxID=2029166 RepID=A0A2T5MI62_9GAMM|nr:DUF3987 domain-containing protein [Stenotrophobium rhamnosiphilum]PTU32245.1 hypothetical protein CJD38_06195 [Stenotrophobium rhamnosiphilum]